MFKLFSSLLSLIKNVVYLVIGIIVLFWLANTFVLPFIGSSEVPTVEDVVSNKRIAELPKSAVEAQIIKNLFTGNWKEGSALVQQHMPLDSIHQETYDSIYKSDFLMNLGGVIRTWME
jgi:hypothetical protein